MKDVPAEYLMAFQRLLAPRPIVYVFPELKGYWYAAAELPGTYQVVLGVSHELYRDVWRLHHEQTGLDIAIRVTVEFRQGSGTVVPVLANPMAMNSQPTMMLEPKYMEPRAVQNFRRT